MLALVFCVGFITYVVSTPTIQPQNDVRIVGGQGIDIKEAPYQVALFSFGRFICGGSIIADNTVITAAHCVNNKLTALQYDVRVGSSSFKKGGHKYPVVFSMVHPSYTSNKDDYDVAILRLASKIKFSDTAKPIQMKNEDEEVSDGAITVVTGWGSLKENGSISENLQKVSVRKVNDQVCKDAYGSNQISPRMLCAGVPEGGKDSCQGDSGGPLIHDNKLAGLVSWGFGCARPQYPGVYTKVSALRAWIDKSVQSISLLHAIG